MRVAKCCRRCKKRHLKCVKRREESSCTRCLETSDECIFDSQYQFKPVHEVETSSQGIRSRTTLDFSGSQTWVQPEQPLSFVLDDGSAVDYGGEHSYEELLVDDTNIDTTNPEDGNSLRSDAFAHLSPSALITSPNTIIDQVQLRNQSSASVPVHATVSAFVTQSPFSSTRAGLAPRADHLSPASITELERRYDEDGVFQRTSPQSNSDSLGISPAASLPTPGGATRAQLTLREACLLQHFIEKIAPWIDACDMSAQFEKEVPKRAMSTPGMLYAILSLSSRHQAIMKSQSQDEASFYHGKCLRLVIEALSSSEHLYDDNMLATVVLLRVYEEIDHSTDMHLHLGGMSRLLSAIPEFSHSGGLAEAASWQALRQDIQVSLSSGQSPSLQLEPYERSSVVSFRDDAACANMVILLFAKILRFVNGTNSQSSQQNLDTYGTLHHQLRRWEHRRQLLFEPTFSAPGGLGTEDPWPVVLLLNAPQVVAMQHYHACEIFLVLHNPRPVSVSGFQAAKQRREVERDIAFHLSNIIGIAKSNPRAENANFTAHHLLRYSGFCITQPTQRVHALRFLAHVKELMGWNTESTKTLLRSQWQDLDSPYSPLEGRT